MGNSLPFSLPLSLSLCLYLFLSRCLSLSFSPSLPLSLCLILSSVYSGFAFLLTWISNWNYTSSHTAVIQGYSRPDQGTTASLSQTFGITSLLPPSFKISRFIKAFLVSSFFMDSKYYSSSHFHTKWLILVLCPSDLPFNIFTSQELKCDHASAYSVSLTLAYS